MASVTKDPNGISIDTISAYWAPQRQATAAVAIFAGAFVYTDGSLGTGIASAKLTDATSANAKLAGIAAAAAGVGNPVTILGKGARLHYAAAGTFTPGAMLYLDVTVDAGGLSTVATTGDVPGVAVAITDMDIMVIRDTSSAAGG